MARFLDTNILLQHLVRENEQKAIGCRELLLRLEFHGATITSDAGLLAFRELDDALDLTPIASDYLQESRTGRNIRHHLVPLLRQSIYSRLAGYDDTNDAERLSQDPAMRVVVGWQGSDRNAARTNTMSRFETETLTQEDNLEEPVSKRR